MPVAGMGGAVRCDIERGTEAQGDGALLVGAQAVDAERGIALKDLFLWMSVTITVSNLENPHRRPYGT